MRRALGLLADILMLHVAIVVTVLMVVIVLPVAGAMYGLECYAEKRGYCR